MAGKTRVVNVVPLVKIKKELPDEDDDEECVQCRLCTKAFASAIALRNHARMEHTEAFATGNSEVWTEPATLSRKERRVRRLQLLKKKSEEMFKSMAPTDLLNLASEDVSYILIKTEPTEPKEPGKKRKAEKEVRAEKVRKEKERVKEKEAQPISGPFECLQPSTLVADGTCHQIFFSCCEYSIHFRSVHMRRRKGLRCQVCEKPLNTDEEPQSPFPCEVCGMGFQTNNELSEHMAIDHVKLKPFECSVCHKRFTQQGGVQQHMRMHTGDRPFNCTFCPKAFTQKSGLDQHIRIHTKVKPYRCVVCSKTFCQSVHLKQHMRTHTNVSPFQCGICSKRFKQSSHLNYHLKNHNTATMTEEQKNEFRKLMALIKTEKSQPMEMYPIHYLDINGHEEVVTAEVQMDDSVVLLDEQSQQQLMLAEQSIQEEKQMEEGEVVAEEVEEDEGEVQIEGEEGEVYGEEGEVYGEEGEVDGEEGEVDGEEGEVDGEEGEVDGEEGEVDGEEGEAEGEEGEVEGEEVFVGEGNMGGEEQVYVLGDVNPSGWCVKMNVEK